MMRSQISDFRLQIGGTELITTVIVLPFLPLRPLLPA